MPNILVAVAILIALLAGAVWSAAVPARRIWPPPGRRSWQYFLTWAGYCAVFGINLLLLLMHWNSWAFQSPLRFVVGIPLALQGGMLEVWGAPPRCGCEELNWAAGRVRVRRTLPVPAEATVCRKQRVLHCRGRDLELCVPVDRASASYALVFVVAPPTPPPRQVDQYGYEYREYAEAGSAVPVRAASTPSARSASRCMVERM